MEAVDTKWLLSRFSRTELRFRPMAETRKLCPQCGASMTEVDRSNENGTVFVWYKCSKDNCDGQWLQRIKQGA